MSKQILLGKIECKKVETLNSTLDKMRKGTYDKTRHYTFLYYRNGDTTTCIMKGGNTKGIGTATKNPKDKENIEHAVVIAECRARADFYIKCAESHIKSIGGVYYK